MFIFEILFLRAYSRWNHFISGKGIHSCLKSVSNSLPLAYAENTKKLTENTLKCESVECFKHETFRVKSNSAECIPVSKADWVPELFDEKLPLYYPECFNVVDDGINEPSYKLQINNIAYSFYMLTRYSSLDDIEHLRNIVDPVHLALLESKGWSFEDLVRWTICRQSRRNLPKVFETMKGYKWPQCLILHILNSHRHTQTTVKAMIVIVHLHINEMDDQVALLTLLRLVKAVMHSRQLHLLVQVLEIQQKYKHPSLQKGTTYNRLINIIGLKYGIPKKELIEKFPYIKKAHAFLLKEMGEKKISLTRVGFQGMITGYAHRNPTHINNWLEKMSASGYPAHRVELVAALNNSVNRDERSSFSALSLSYYDLSVSAMQIALAKDSFEASKIFDKIRESGEIPDVWSWGMLLFKALEENVIGPAGIEKAWKKILKDGILPNQFLIQQIIRGVKGDTDKITLLLNKLPHPFAFRIQTVQTYLQQLVENGQRLKASQVMLDETHIFERYSRYRSFFFRDLKCWQVVIRGWANVTDGDPHQRISRMKLLWDRMITHGVKPSSFTLFYVCKSAASFDVEEGIPQGSIDIFNEMITCFMKCDSSLEIKDSAWACFIHLAGKLSRVQTIAEALELLSLQPQRVPSTKLLSVALIYIYQQSDPDLLHRVSRIFKRWKGISVPSRHHLDYVEQYML